MSTNKHPHVQYGFTLIEIIIFIVVVSVGMVGILSVMNSVVKSSADPMVRKQAMALAESTLEEIMLHNYADPDGTNVGESVRTDWDNIQDYQGKTNADLGTSGNLASYVIGINIASDTAVVGSVAHPAWRIAVTVTNGTTAIAMTGYRACYGEVSAATGLSLCP